MNTPKTVLQVERERLDIVASIYHSWSGEDPCGPVMHCLAIADAPSPVKDAISLGLILGDLTRDAGGLIGDLSLTPEGRLLLRRVRRQLRREGVEGGCRLPSSLLRQCRICGCTDITACQHDDGTPCAWMDDDLCTVCDERLATLPERLAACLAEAVDTPLLVLKEPDGHSDLELRLAHFRPDIANRAAELLEEAGK